MRFIEVPDHGKAQDLQYAENNKQVKRNDLGQWSYDKHYQRTVGYSQGQGTRVFYAEIDKITDTQKQY